MFYMPKIADYLKIMTDEYIKTCSQTFDECFKYIKEKLHSKLGEEKSLRKVEESFLYFLGTPDQVKKYAKLIEKMSEAKLMTKSSSSNNCVHYFNISILNPFDPELQLINTKPTVKKI